MTKKDKFAVLYVQEARFWEVCNKVGWPDSMLEDYRKVCKVATDFGEANFPRKITIMGTQHDENISHYDMDQAIDEKFGKSNEDITTDSESGGFYCYVAKPKLEEVLAFIEDKFPGFKTSTSDDGFKNPFVNWSDAENYVKEKGLEVPRAYSDELLAKSVEIGSIDKQIKDLEEQKEKLIGNIK